MIYLIDLDKEAYGIVEKSIAKLNKYLNIPDKECIGIIESIAMRAYDISRNNEEYIISIESLSICGEICGLAFNANNDLRVYNVYEKIIRLMSANLIDLFYSILKPIKIIGTCNSFTLYETYLRIN